jgi:hypothetical protein
VNGRYLHLPSVDTDDEPAEDWGGHFFPSPEEIGIDPEAFPAKLGNCACGMTYAAYQRDGEGCSL